MCNHATAPILHQDGAGTVGLQTQFIKIFCAGEKREFTRVPTRKMAAGFPVRIMRAEKPDNRWRDEIKIAVRRAKLIVGTRSVNYKP
jgi:hypothetical protein